ncbi:3-phosphoshikimate 1-carboxyvinyltransferase [Deinococcota bacterium DY0809b]
MSEADLEARSPWSAYTGVAAVRLVPPAEPVRAELAVPGSKSVTNRAIVLAGLAEGTSELSGILKSDDAWWALAALRTLGLEVEVAGGTARIGGGGGRWPAGEAEVYVGAAGTLGRFLPPALAAAPEGRFWVRASRRMSQRPIAPLVEALRALGARVDYADVEGRFPLIVHGAGLAGGEVTLPGNVSSQFTSGVLLAAPYARRPVTVQVAGGMVQPAYVRITLAMMRVFGAEVEAADDLSAIRVAPGRYRGRTLALEADASSAAYFFALAAASGGEVTVSNIGSATLQPDLGFVYVLERMGARVEVGPTHTTVRGPEKLRGGFEVSLKAMSDQTPTLAALAALADAPVTITEVAHVRHHESDRIAAMASELGRLGLRVEEHPDGLTVWPGRPRPARLDPHDDHRIAMSLALLSLAAPGLEIANPGTTSKTFPSYWDYLERLGFHVEAL